MVERSSGDLTLPKLGWLSLVRTLDKQKALVLMTWLSVTAITVFAVARMPRAYKAETLIMVESQKIPEKLVSATVSAELQDRIASLSQQILSTGRLENLIDKFHLYGADKNRPRQEVIDEMRKDIYIRVEKGWTRNQPGAFRVAYTGQTPEVAAAVTNQIGRFFVEENTRTRESQAAGASEFLVGQLKEAKRSLEVQEAKLSQYKLTHNGQLPEQKDALLATLQRLQLELQGLQDGINRSQQQKVILENAVATADISLTELTKATEEMQNVRETIITVNGTQQVVPATKRRSEVLEAELELLRRRYTDTHPDVAALKIELAKVQELEAREVRPQPSVAQPAPAKPPQRSSPELAQMLIREKERIASLKGQLDAAEKDIVQRESDRNRVLAQLSNYQARLEMLPVREQEMASITRDYQITKSNYESLLNKNMTAEMASEMEKGRKAERFVVTDPARVPERPERPKKLLLWILGSAAGFGLGLVLAFARELNRNVVLGDWEIPEEFPVLTRIPAIPAGTGAASRL